VTCEKCGNELQIGDYPFCPHGSAFPSVIDDQLEGGARFFEHMGHEPVWIESKSQWRQEVKARQLVNVDKYDSAHYAKKRKEHDEKLRDERL
jgi:hypothetical protein